MTRPAHDRNAEIVALHDAGYTDVEIAATTGEITPSRVGAIVRRATDAARTPGRRPTDAVTPGSQRGRAALATLTADAAAVGLTVEVYLARARSWLTAERDDLDRQVDARDTDG